MFVPLDLEVDFEAFYLGHHEVFHAYAEVHFGNRETAEEVIHEVFLEIHMRLVAAAERGQPRTGRVGDRAADRPQPPRRRGAGVEAFVINGPIAQALDTALVTAREKLRKMESSSGLYEAIAELPDRQFEVIVLRYVLGYPTAKVAWYIGIDDRTVGHHLRRAKERLRLKLGLPETPKKHKGVGA